MRVCIDPGHGGCDPGAVGPAGTCEKNVNLMAARALLLILEGKGYQVYSTRGRDIYVPLLGRCQIAKDVKADVFVSLHANGSVKPSAHGTEFWTSVGDTPADPLATAMYERWKVAFPGGIIRTDYYSDGDPDKERDFAVLARTPMPAVLVELGFITHPQEELVLQSDRFLATACGAIADGISDWSGGR